MLTIAEEDDDHTEFLSVQATAALPRAVLSEHVRVSTASGGFGGTQLQRARLSSRQSRPVDLGTDLNIAGEKCTIKAPLTGILANAEAVLPADGSGDCDVRVPIQSDLATSHRSSHSSAARPRPEGPLGGKDALKLIKRKRARARKQKVNFSGLVAEGGTAIPPKGEAVYMPAYIPKSKSRTQVRNAQLGADAKEPVGTLGLVERRSEDHEGYFALSANKPLMTRASEHGASDLPEEVNDTGLNENKSEIRQRVSFAIGQVRQTVLKHILLRNKLIDAGIQLNTLPKANVVALVLSSQQATRELLRGSYLQGAGGSHVVLNDTGVESLGKYKKLIELETTPRPVSDTYNLSVIAGPGIFQRNRFPPGSTALERLTWWEKQADVIFRDYEHTMAVKARGGDLPSLEGWVEDKEKYFVMFDDKHQMHKILDKDPSAAKQPDVSDRAQAAELAEEAESELSEAISAAQSAQAKLSRAQRSGVPTPMRTSFSMASQRIDTNLRTGGARTSWPRTSDRRSVSQIGPESVEEGTNTTRDENAALRPVTMGGFIRRRAVSVDPDHMGGEGIRKLTPVQRMHGGRSPLRYRVREEDRIRGSLSPSKFVSGGEFLPEYAHKNTFAGGRRSPCIRAGEPYQDQTYDHLNTLLAQKTPKRDGVAEGPELPPHLLALKNLGTKRWRKAYERGITNFVPEVALNPRDSRIFDLWGSQHQPLPPPVQPRRETPEHLKKGMMKQARGGYSHHVLGEPQVRDSNVYHFASVLHPSDNMRA